MMKRIGILVAGMALAVSGCVSHIVPMRPLQHVEMWQADGTEGVVAATEPGAVPASAPASQPASQSASQPATQPGHMVQRVVDPNQTARFIYKATYDTIWQQAMDMMYRAGFTLDRKDYRLGVLISQALPSAQVIEFWKPQHVNVTDSLENTVNSQRRIVKLTISKVPEKPEFYEIGVQVLVERQTNPTETIGGPVFIEGSGFGRNLNALRSDYVAPTTPAGGDWVTVGHDPDLERKLIAELFARI